MNELGNPIHLIRRKKKTVPCGNIMFQIQVNTGRKSRSLWSRWSGCGKLLLVITLKMPPMRCQAELTPWLGRSTQATPRPHCLYLARKPISGHAQLDLYHTLTINGIYVHSCRSKIQGPNSRSPVRDVTWTEEIFFFPPLWKMQLTNWERRALWNYARVPTHFRSGSPHLN